MGSSGGHNGMRSVRALGVLSGVGCGVITGHCGVRSVGPLRGQSEVEDWDSWGSQWNMGYRSPGWVTVK